jgi:hypothetical protein
MLGGIDHKAGERPPVLHGGEPPPHQLPGCFNVQVPARPGHRFSAHGRYHGLPDIAHHVQRYIVGTQQHAERVGACATEGAGLARASSPISQPARSRRWRMRSPSEWMCCSGRVARVTLSTEL